MGKFNLTALAGLMLLSGCSMAPNYQLPEVAMADVYMHSGAQGTEQSSTFSQSWWTSFEDAELNQLVEAAQQQNITLKIASERIQSAQAYQQSVASFKVPSLSVSGGYADIRLSQNEAMMGKVVSGVALPDMLGGGKLSLMSKDQQDFTLGLNASWELDLFGRIDSLSQAASIGVEQANIMKNATNTLITAEVINNYLQYRGAEERIAIARVNIQEQQQTLQLVESLTRHGYGSELDVANAKAALATTRSSLPMLETAKSVHLNRLAILLGENIAQTQGRFSPLPLPAMNALVPTGLPSELLTRRPDIAMAERTVAAQNQQVGAAIASQYPSFFLTGAPSLVAGDFGDLFEADSSSWVLGAGFSWNLFDGGRTEALLKMQQAGFNEAVLNYQNTVNAAINEVETALKAYANGQQYHQHMTEANNQAQSAVDKATALYRAGLVNHLAVLDAQRQKNQLQDAEVVARLNTATNVVLLHKALGGNWSVTPVPAP
ncbi:efflux transporter outer membrane subunit [Bowmanella pacifica]|uniref:Outer membrane protein n=1 Tax=Bowmanella pacifica TaxID=502051 RepID=A0A917YTL5_9ALTE|nr:TolC family protein [Bowmanella pacifica]GGO66180.1 outer membrane protein [Bowmanella pacifica]